MAVVICSARGCELPAKCWTRQTGWTCEYHDRDRPLPDPAVAEQPC